MTKDIDEAKTGNLFILNMPMLTILGPDGNEIVLQYGVDYESFLFGADSFEKVGLSMYEKGLVGKVKDGKDTQLNITPDRRHATLKNGETVFYGVRILERARGKVTGVTFVLTTAPKSGVPDITNNFFKIKYVESVGGHAGDVKTDSTSGNAYQVINPAGDFLYYFSFTAVVKSAGIQTTIVPHFFGGAIVREVSPKYIQCCCVHTKKPLPRVPEITSCWWYGFAHISKWFVSCFRAALAKAVCANTANVPCEGPEATGVEITITGDGFERIKNELTPDRIKITDEQGSVARVTRITEITNTAIKATMDITACRPGTKCVKIEGAGGFTTLTLIKIVQDIPDTIAGQRRFQATRILGTQEKLALTTTLSPGADGKQNITFADAKYQVYDVTCVTRNGDTTATTTTTGGCNNIATTVIQGACTPGAGEDNITVTYPAGTCTAPIRNAHINLTTDIDGKNGIEPDPNSGDEKNNVEENPGATILTADAAFENEYPLDSMKAVQMTLRSPAEGAIVTLSMETMDGTSPIMEVFVRFEGSPFFSPFLSTDDVSALVDLNESSVFWVKGLRPGTAKLKITYLDPSGQAGNVNGVETDVIVFHVAELNIIDGQAFEPYLETTPPGNAIPKLRKDLTETVDQKYLRVGALADGTSIVVLQFKSIDTSNVQIETKRVTSTRSDDTTSLGGLFLGNKDQLPPLPASPDGGGTTAIELKGASTVIYRPPVSWRAEVKSVYGYIELVFLVRKDNLVIGSRHFRLEPPPLVLVHGILSGPVTWNTLEARIKDAGMQRVVVIYKVDYSTTTTSGFDVNHILLKEQVYGFIKERRDRGIAATRVDMLTHSMGGLLARWWFIDRASTIGREPKLGYPEKNLTYDGILDYSGVEAYKRGDNYGVGSVRRFMTVGAPHLGSYWANAVAVASHTAIGADLLLYYMNDKKIVDIDAISDLAVDSSAITVLKSMGTNTHSRYTAGQLGPIEIPPNTGKDPFLELYYEFLSYVVERAGDGVVGVESQGNGSSPTPANVINKVFHTQETSAEGLFLILTRLLRDDMLLEFDNTTNTSVH